jgi:hypothetical protein
MADQSIQILIKTIADATGITLTTEQIGKLKEAMDDSKESAGGLADATDILKQSDDSAHESVEKLHISHRALHLVMQMIGRETSPMLGRALTGALYGPIGMVIALGAAVEWVKKSFDEYNKSLDEQGAQAAKPAFDAIKNIASQWDESKKRMGDYFAALSEAGKSKDTVDEALKTEKQITDAKIDGIKKVIEALGQEALARARNMGATEEQLQEIEKKTKTSIEGLGDQKKTGDINRLKKELAERNAPGEQMSLDEQARAAQSKADAAAIKLKNAQDELKTIRDGEDGKGKSPAVTRLEELEKVKERNDSMSVVGPNMGKNSKGTAMINEAVEAARQAVNREKARRKQLEAEIERLQELAATANTEAGNAQTKGKHNAERVAELPGLIGTQDKVDKFEDTDKTIEGGVVAELAVMKSGKANQQQTEAINKLHALADASGTSMSAILLILYRSIAAHSSQQDQIAAIQQQFVDLNARIPPTY